MLEKLIHQAKTVKWRFFESPFYLQLIKKGEKMKVALINPKEDNIFSVSEDYLPMGIGYIRTFLESQELECDLYDFS